MWCDYVCHSALWPIIHVMWLCLPQRPLAWWPNISIIYNKATELRNMFTDTLNKVTQGMTSHTAPKSTVVGGLPYVRNIDVHFSRFLVIFNLSHRAAIVLKWLHDCSHNWNLTDNKFHARSKSISYNTVNSAYNELLGTMKNSSLYPEFPKTV